MHVEMGLDSMFGYRPLPELAGYRTPVRGLFLTGASTHPGGGLFGAPVAQPPASSMSAADGGGMTMPTQAYSVRRRRHEPRCRRPLSLASGGRQVAAQIATHSSTERGCPGSRSPVVLFSRPA